jgi:O-antigen/teichoic acid export membrane protein
MLLTAAVALGGVFNAGTGAATIKSVSSGIGRNAAGNTERTVNASVAIAFLGGGFLALLLFSIFWFGASTILGRMGDPELIRLTGTVAALLVWLEQLDNVFSSAMKGAEYFAQAARVEIVSKTSQVAAAALIMVASPTLWSVYLILLIVALLRLSAKIAVAKRLLRITRVRPSLANVSEILHFAKWGWLQGVGGVLFGVADRVLVGALLGATSLTYYSIASQLTMQIHASSAAGLSVIFPILSRKLEARDNFSLRRATLSALGGNVIVGSALAITLWLIGAKLLEFWLGEVQAGPVFDVLPYLIIAYWLLAVNVTPHYVLLSLGKIRYVSISNLVAGFVLVVAIAVVAPLYGLDGVAAARILYGLVILVNFVPLVVRLRSAELT